MTTIAKAKPVSIPASGLFGRKGAKMVNFCDYVPTNSPHATSLFGRMTGEAA
ncbi:hypothetical protein [uncultured Erythrobacter sp.]|uniref:hypothetical protein n=1 Tax=uncultured Erythrobacter sp. TaxID=263913 RepID=UPI0026019977|nr:hypothetical protein [uncultured Erythrobacter sp.]